MSYSAEQTALLQRQKMEITQDIQSLFLAGFGHSQAQNEETKKYLLQGVGRRLGVIKTSIEVIFSLFPPDRDRPLTRDALNNVQINLQALVINSSGIFDNWAWAFIYRHNLLQAIGNRRNVEMFKAETQRWLPAQLRSYLAEGDIERWHEIYLKEYRDALAHRIPPYIPPCNFTNAEADRYRSLEAQKAEFLRTQEWDRLDAVWAEQDSLGTASAMFLHEFSAEANRGPLQLHPQVLTDALTVVEFGRRFYEFWDVTSAGARN